MKAKELRLLDLDTLSRLATVCDRLCNLRLSSLLFFGEGGIRLQKEAQKLMPCVKKELTRRGCTSFLK